MVVVVVIVTRRRRKIGRRVPGQRELPTAFPRAHSTALEARPQSVKVVVVVVCERERKRGEEKSVRG